MTRTENLCANPVSHYSRYSA